MYIKFFASRRTRTENDQIFELFGRRIRRNGCFTKSLYIYIYIVSGRGLCVIDKSRFRANTNI